ncbi:MAG: geranylgeranyl reductase family protein [Bacteroidota bacterium]
MGENTLKFDVVICGAGPAGSTCALALGSSGLKVALMDKDSFPREKVCGDAVAPYVRKVLNTIHPDYAKALDEFSLKEKVNRIRFVAPNKKKLEIQFADEGFISTRLNFDNFLFNLAAKLNNVQVFLNTTVKDVIALEEGFRISTGNNICFEASMVIGCDGAHSMVNKKLTHTSMDLKHHSGAVRAYYKNISGLAPGTFEFHFIKDLLPGYFWIFPLPDNTANVGLGLLSQNISNENTNLRNKMLEIIESEPQLKERFANAEMLSPIKGFGLPLGSRKVTMSGKGFMLCGDAASLVDPISGEGIGEAIVSGRYAAWQAMDCFRENNFSAKFMKAYDEAVYKKFWQHHLNRYRARKLINNRAWILNGLVNFAEKNKWFNRQIKKILS